MAADNLTTTAIVEKVYASGMWVRLADQRKAWLPAAELFSDHKPHQDLRSKASGLVGTQLPVCELKSGLGGYREALVSHIRATNDPWRELVKWKDGELKVMEITLTTPKRAIGIIKPGIRAEVSMRHFTSELSRSWADFAIPLPGDEVAGFYYSQGVDEDRRIVSLEFLKYAKSQVRLSDILLPSSDPNASHQVNNEPKRLTFSRPSLDALDLRQIKTVLLVDDDQAILSLSEVLVDEFKIFPCRNAEAAMEVIQNDELRIDLAILDLHLRETSDDFEGLAVGRALKAKHPYSTIVIITGAEIDVKHRDRLQAAGFEIKDVIQKPFGFEEFFRALTAKRGDRRWDTDIDQPSQTPKARFDSQTKIRETRLATAIDILRREVGADGVILFSVDPVAYSIEIVASSGEPKKYSIPKPRLDLSPVRDAAIDDESIFTNNATSSNDFPKHRWLQRGYEYESCIGVGVHTGQANNLAYSLFAFHKEPHRFTPYDINAVSFAAMTLKEALRNRSLEEELRQMKPFELMGKLYGSMAHDLKAVLSDDFLFEKVEQALQKHDISEGLTVLSTLKARSLRAQDIVRTFRDMARQQQQRATEFPVYAALASVVSNFSREVRHSASVTLLPRRGKDALVLMRKVGFEQMIVNILMNASQQIQLCDFRPESTRGEIAVECFVEGDANDGYSSVIRVYDTGPGIHRRDYERVFDLHYTTKPDGCGMGLDICRQIAIDGRVGNRTGRVLVKRSILMGGSVLEVTLPVKKLLDQ